MPSERSWPLVRRLSISVVLLAPPMAILADYYCAIWGGWIPEAPLFGRLPAIIGWLWLAVAVVALIASKSLRQTRRALAARLALATFAGLAAAAVGDALVRLAVPCTCFHLRPPHAIFELRPDPSDYVQVSSLARSTHNAEGLRGPAMPPLDEARRVICVGGSTTECLFLDDADTWTSQLMGQLNAAGRGRYWVGSAGHCDYASGHHLRFINQTPLVDHTVAVVVLIGVEDLMRHLMRLDAGETAPPFVLQTCAAQLATNLWNARLRHGLAIDITGHEYAHNRHGLVFPAWPVDPTFDDAVAAYSQRLRAIVDVGRRRHLKLVFVTQPVLWADELSGQGLARLAVARSFPKPPPWKYLTPENLRRAIDKYNLALLKVAADEGLACVDAAAVLSGRPTCFYDDYHFTIEGAAEFARLVASELLAGDKLGQSSDVGVIAEQGWRESAPEPSFQLAQ